MIKYANALVYVGEGFTFTQEVGENSFSVRAEAYKDDELVYTDYADIVVDNHDYFAPHIWSDPMKMIEYEKHL